MPLFIEFLETIAALGSSGAVAYLLGGKYVTILALVFVACWLLMLEAAHRRGEAIEEPVGFLDVAEITAAAAVFAMIWPSIPLILLLRGERAPTQR